MYGDVFYITHIPDVQNFRFFHICHGKTLKSFIFSNFLVPHIYFVIFVTNIRSVSLHKLQKVLKKEVQCVFQSHFKDYDPFLHPNTPKELCRQPGRASFLENSQNLFQTSLLEQTLCKSLIASQYRVIFTSQTGYMRHPRDTSKYKQIQTIKKENDTQKFTEIHGISRVQLQKSKFINIYACPEQYDSAGKQVPFHHLQAYPLICTSQIDNKYTTT